MSNSSKIANSSLNQSLTNGELALPISSSNSNSLSTKTSNTNGRPLKLRRVNHTDEIVFGFSSLLTTESMTDVTLICNRGQTIRAHRVILSTFSPYFRAIFEAQPFANNPCQYPVIVIKDLELSELKTIIDFIYKGEVSVSRDKLQSVLQAAKALEVSGLADLKLESFGVSSSATSNGNSVNTLLASSLMNSPNGNNSSSANNLSDLDQLNLGSLSALNYVCNLNGNKRGVTNSLDTSDLFTTNENQLKKLRVSIEDSNELLNSLGTSLLGDNTVNIDGVRSLLQQPPRLPQAIQQLKQQQAQQLQINQFQQQLQKQRQMQQLLQRQQSQQRQIQQRIQQQQLKQQFLQLSQNGNSKNKYSVPKNNTLQGSQLMQFQEKIKQQIQDKQSKAENGNGKASAEDLTKLNKKDNDAEEGLNSSKNEEGIDEKGSNENGNASEQNENDLIVDDENNNQINKLEEDQEDDKKGDEKNTDDLDNGNTNFGDFDENADQQQLNQDEEEEEYEIDIDKDLVFQRQQQIRLEQIQKQQHFHQFQLMQVEDTENRNLDFQQHILQATANMRNGGEINLTTLNNGRRNSSKDSLLQTSSASGSEDTDNDNNTMELNDNLSIMDNNFFEDYNNLTSRSPIPMQVKLDPQLNRIPQTPDFLLPRGPGRPRKGNKGSDISPCPECHKKFVRPDVLKLHYRSVHLNERHPCNMCPKIFKWPGDLSKHKRTKHPEAFPSPSNNNNNNNNSANNILAIN